MKKILLALFAVVSLTSFGGDVYIREGAAGNGSSWASALPNFPHPLVRGNTYYVADGTYYAGGRVTVPRSGTIPIVVRKATVADHGTSTGWSDSYGDGQANIGRWSISENTGYITFDGVYRYGFRVDVPNGNNTSAFSIRNDNGDSVPNLTFRYVEIVGPGDGAPYAYSADAGARGIHIYYGLSGGPTYPNMTISRCSIRGCIDLMLLGSAHNLLVEYTELAWSWSSNPSAHGNIAIMWDVNNATWRYNVIRDFNAEGILLATRGSNWKVYGNLCYNGSSTSYPRFMETYPGGTYSNHVYYNNTLVDLWLGFNFAGADSGHVVRNNIFYRVRGNTWNGQSNSDNWYGSTTSPFVNYPVDFRLTKASAPQNAGAVLPAEFALDSYGSTRGADGAWDIGAFEYRPSILPPGKVKFVR